MTGTPPKASWENLQRPQRAARPALSDGDTPDELVWRAVSAGVGADLLAWLREEYIEHRDRPESSDAQLRESEAQRRLVRDLEKMRDRGAEIARAKAAAPKT